MQNRVQGTLGPFVQRVRNRRVAVTGKSCCSPGVASSQQRALLSARDPRGKQQITESERLETLSFHQALWYQLSCCVHRLCPRCHVDRRRAKSRQCRVRANPPWSLAVSWAYCSIVTRGLEGCKAHYPYPGTNELKNLHQRDFLCPLSKQPGPRPPRPGSH